MSNEIKNVKGAVVKEINGVKYFKLVSKYPGDYTKNCGLLANEIDENFFFLRSYDIQDMQFNDKNELVLTRVDGDTLTAALPDLPAILFEKMKFEFDKNTGKLIITYPDGSQEILDGFFVAGEEIKVATDFTIRGDGRVSNPLRISETEKTGTYAPAEYFLDRTDGTPMPDVNKEHKGKGFRIVTKENYTPFGRLYTYEGIQKINEHLQEISSPWRIPSRKDWADLLNAAEYCEEDRNHDTVEVNTWTGKYAGGRAKSASSWKTVQEGGEEVSYSDDNLPTTGSYSTFHVIPIGYGEGSRGVLAEDWNDDIEGLTKLSSFWTNTPTGSHFKSPIPNIFTRTFSYDTRKVLQESSKPSSRLSLRLVKDYDYDCTEFNEYDYILGDAVPTLLISNPEVGYSKVWTSINIGLANPEYSGVTSVFWNKLSGEDKEVKEVFYINEWNGKEWVKKQMRPGDSVVILDYDNDPSTSGDTYHEWRVYEYEDGTSELIDTAVALKEEFQEEIDRLDERIDNEIERAVSAETTLQEEIDDEIARAQSAETMLAEAIDSIEVREVTPNDSGDTLKSYAIFVNGEQREITIDVPKDDVQGFKEIVVGWSGATIDENTGEWTYWPETGDTEVLYIVYKTSEDKYKLSVIPLESFIFENEFADGLSADTQEHVVRVLIDPESDDYLTVSLNGLKLTGVNDKFDELSGSVVEEIERAQSAETMLQEEIDDESERAISAETILKEAIEAEAERLNELSASTVEEIERLDGKDIVESGSTMSIQDGFITLKRENGEEIKINIDTNFGLLP